MKGVRDIPDHVREISPLARRAVDVDPDLPAGRVSDLLHRIQRPDWRRLGKRLADIPWALPLAHFDLQVATRHVEADRVTPDDAERIRRGELHTAGTDRSDELYFMV